MSCNKWTVASPGGLSHTCDQEKKGLVNMKTGQMKYSCLRTRWGKGIKRNEQRLQALLGHLQVDQRTLDRNL